MSLQFTHPLPTQHHPSPAAEDGCGCTVSNYIQITDLLNRPLSHSLCTSIGWDPTAQLNQPVSCRAETFCARGNDITAPRPATQTLKTDEEQMSFRCLVTSSIATQFSLCWKNLWGENNPAVKQLFLERHCEVCLLDTKRLRETLHVKVELLFFSPTLWWVVSSCRQAGSTMLALQLECVSCFAQNASTRHFSAYYCF